MKQDRGAAPSRFALGPLGLEQDTPFPMISLATCRHLAIGSAATHFGRITGPSAPAPKRVPSPRQLLGPSLAALRHLVTRLYAK